MKITIETNNMKELIDLGVFYGNEHYINSVEANIECNMRFNKITIHYLKVLGLYNLDSHKHYELYVNGILEERGLNLAQLINRILNVGWNKEGILLGSLEDNCTLFLFTN